MYRKKNVHLNASERTIKFIQLYRSCECLWNVTSKDYGNKLSRNAAYYRISRKMRISGLGPLEVSRKIMNLKSAYQQEVKKIEEKLEMGVVYRPSVVWFDLLDEFLRKSDKSMEHNRRLNDNRLIDRSDTIQQTTSNIDDIKNVVSLTSNVSKYESSSENECNSSSRRNITSVIDIHLNERRKIRKRRRKSKENVDDIKLDEYENFGKYVATNLKKMPFEYAISAETEIHSIIIKYKVYAMRKIVYSPHNSKTGITKTTTNTIKPSTYLTPTNFSSILRHPIEEIQST